MVRSCDGRARHYMRFVNELMLTIFHRLFIGLANDICYPEFLKNMSASADVLALAKVEVDLNTIPEGKNVSQTCSYRWCSLGHLLTCSRSLSNGVASLSSSGTGPPRRSRRPTRLTFSHCETLRPTRTASSDRSGLLC